MDDIISKTRIVDFHLVLTNLIDNLQGVQVRLGVVASQLRTLLALVEKEIEEREAQAKSRPF